MKDIFRITSTAVLVAALAAISSSFGAVPAHSSGVARLVSSTSDCPSEVPLYGKFECTFMIPAGYSNPFDPADIKVDGYFTPPNGDPLVQPGFYYQEYVVEGINKIDPGNADEKYIPLGDPVWKVRFAPQKLGEYSYSIKYSLGGGALIEILSGEFNVLESDKPGFIGVSRDHPRYFEFSNGDLFIGTGLNVGWWDKPERAISYYLYFFDRMQTYQANLVRMWMTNSVVEVPNPLEGLLTAERILSLQDKTLGKDYNLKDAYAFDRILKDAEDKGIYILLTLEDAHQFSKNWENNLYNKNKNPDGPCPSDDPDDDDHDGYDDDNDGIFDGAECLVNPEVWSYQEKIFRYIVARWGYSTSLFSLELFNEIDEEFIYYDEPQKSQLWDTLKGWHINMGNYTRSIDSQRHLVNTSTGSFQTHKDLYQDTGMDFSEMHFYYYSGDDRSDPIGRDMAAFTWEYANQVLGTYTNPDLPGIIGEFGLNEVDKKKDMEGVHLHNGLWSSLKSGMATSGLSWYWQLHKNPDHDWWRHYTPLANYFDGIDTDNLTVMAPLNIKLLETESPPSNDFTWSDSDPKIRAMGLRGGESGASVFAWIQNRTNTWYKNYIEKISPEPISGSLTIPGLCAGDYKVEMWDTYQEGVVSDLGIFSTSNGSITLGINNLTTDVAFKILNLSISGSAETPLVVTNTENAGTGSLRQAICIANHNPGPDTITFDLPGGGAGTIRLQTSLPFINDDLTIEGGGVITISGENLNRVFNIHYETTLNLNDLWIVNGLASDTVEPVGGGAIRNFGTVNLTNSTLSGNNAGLAGGVVRNLGNLVISGSVLEGNSAPYGGAIHNSGTLTVLGSLIQNNEATADGGGIFNTGTLTIQNTSLLGNQAVGGGGILNWEDGVVTLSTSAVSWNSATFGGGIENGSNGVVTLDSNSSIEGNTASNLGGGIWNFDSGEVTLKESMLSGNTALNDDPAFPVGGGGLHNSGNGEAWIIISSVTGNSAFYGGAIQNWENAVTHIEDSTVESNTAENGGGIEMSGGSTSITGSTIAKNTAEGCAGINAMGGEALDITNSTISGNIANGMGSGGGLCLSIGTHLTNVTITGNQSYHAGGMFSFALSNAVTVQNTIIAGNLDDSGNPDCFTEGGLISLDYNLIGDGTGLDFLPAAHDLVGIQENPINPLLGPLANNGGLTQTHALLPGSPAIDAIPNANCAVLTDQTGITKRPQGLGCDIGAFELPQKVRSIDIKPGAFPNTINPTSTGTVQVAVLSTKTFSAPSAVQQNSLTFGHSGWEPSLVFLSTGKPNCISKDVNGDGRLDLLCKFTIKKTGFLCQDTVGILRGKTKDNKYFVGEDSVVIQCP